MSSSIFDKTLEKTEEDIFFPLLRALFIETMKNVKANPFLDAHTIIYFNVALKLIDPELSLGIPLELEEASEDLYNAIMGQSSIIYNDLTILFMDDFSQYKPRGHYTKTETLKKYFRLYKWLARIPFFFGESSGSSSLNVSIIKMVHSAIQVTWLLKNTKIDYLDNQISGFDIWDTIMGFLDVVMGPLNSITPNDVDNHCSNLIRNDWNLSEIDEELLLQIQESILNDPDILYPDIPFYVDALTGNVESPKAFTLFGEIETLDSYSLQHVVHPYIGYRLLPHGLDFAYTCLESNRALQLLHDEYPNENALDAWYDPQLACGTPDSRYGFIRLYETSRTTGPQNPTDSGNMGNGDSYQLNFALNVSTSMEQYNLIDFNFSSSYGNANVPENNTNDAWLYLNPSAVGDSCDYVSGDWNVDCSQNCEIDTDTNIGTNDIIFTGVGTIYLNANINAAHYIFGGECIVVFASDKMVGGPSVP